ncbi:sensor histidine kinase [Sediminibacterium sp.]|uniref:sensor histidine kinase n=1 Tax=Sediminibacterium sp. TaxID=1917865 RepID=UPI0025E59D20|nr:sensor histidine kinase [Sediminibacterium sp.]
MKYLLKSVLILIFPIFGWAQNSAVNITPEKFSNEIYTFPIDAADGWVFHKGNDTNWSKKDIDIKGWEKLKPTDLSAKYADKNGRVEGWFRIKVTFDSSLLNKVLYVDFGQWAATAFYIDGELVTARGNTGEKGKDFREYNGGLDPLSFRFDTPAPHVFSLHYVGYLSPVPPYDLKTKNFNRIVGLCGPNYITKRVKNAKISYTFTASWLVVCAILSMLFWLLLLQNPKEKNLFWIALYTTAFTIYIYFWSSAFFYSGITFIEFKTYYFLTGLFQTGTLFLLLPILIIKVFNRKINSKLFLSLIILYIFNILVDFLSSLYSETSPLIFGASIVFILGVCLYYVIISWKSLKGAQWAIVAGLIFTAFILLAGIILALIFRNFANSSFFNSLFTSFYFLAFPLSLLVYVSMRFKEMIKEVQENAQTVVELSEEKKVQAENQQKVLEEEVTRQTSEIRQTLENLKTTQSQLIQSEKMASLGELTAGIAHEIQNPLNFVNNFSEVNTELIDELKQEMDKGNLEDARAIADDIKENEEKINHHGKRADAIVKGMLQHSRSNSGVKEPTDINALADEYLRLAYHGLRAKDKSFNANLHTDFDKSIGSINIVPQDIGRLMVNLINNAFYAVDEKQKAERLTPNAENYQPTVSVSTKKTNERVEIIVKDNGNGIPVSIKEKIFQPFFTTKPTGQGTGLGLSLSYDILKAHGGELKVETKENEGTEFIIQLPI